MNRLDVKFAGLAFPQFKPGFQPVLFLTPTICQAVLSAGSIVNKQDGGSGRFCPSSSTSKARALCSDRKAGPRNVRNCVQGIQEGNVSENLKLRRVQVILKLTSRRPCWLKGTKLTLRWELE